MSNKITGRTVYQTSIHKLMGNLLPNCNLLLMLPSSSSDLHTGIEGLLSLQGLDENAMVTRHNLRVTPLLSELIQHLADTVNTVQQCLKCYRKVVVVTYHNDKATHILPIMTN